MKIRYSPYFYKKYKKANVRIRKSFDEKIAIFIKNPNNLQLNNHPLHKPYQDFKSIDITGDWRALYKELITDEEIVAYFVDLDTHEGLYGN